MKKKPAKHTTMGERVTAAEVAARREQHTLRRIANLHRSITSLSSQLRRAIRRSDAARLDAARELCADTGYGVFGLAEVENAQRQVTELRAANTSLLTDLSQLRAAPASVGA